MQPMMHQTANITLVPNSTDTFSKLAEKVDVYKVVDEICQNLSKLDIVSKKLIKP